MPNEQDGWTPQPEVQEQPMPVDANTEVAPVPGEPGRWQFLAHQDAFTPIHIDPAPLPQTADAEVAIAGQMTTQQIVDDLTRHWAREYPVPEVPLPQMVAQQGERARSMIESMAAQQAAIDAQNNNRELEDVPWQPNPQYDAMVRTETERQRQRLMGPPTPPPQANPLTPREIMELMNTGITPVRAETRTPEEIARAALTPEEFEARYGGPMTPVTNQALPMPMGLPRHVTVDQFVNRPRTPVELVTPYPVWNSRPQPKNRKFVPKEPSEFPSLGSSEIEKETPF